MQHSWIPRQKRVPFHVRARVSGLDGVPYAYTANVSEGGIYIKTPKAPPEVPIGTQLTVTFRLPHGGPELALAGTIVWVDADARDHLGRHATGMGLRFEPGHLDERAHIGRFVK